jgi:hypothetical protein
MVRLARRRAFASAQPDSRERMDDPAASSLKALRLSSVSVAGFVSFCRSRRSHLFALMLA